MVSRKDSATEMPRDSLKQVLGCSGLLKPTPAPFLPFPTGPKASQALHLQPG